MKIGIANPSCCVLSIALTDIWRFEKLFDFALLVWPCHLHGAYINLLELMLLSFPSTHGKCYCHSQILSRQNKQ